MSNSIVFFDDFSDGIWTKYAGNPILVRSQLELEDRFIQEPNILYENGIFRMWFSQMDRKGQGTALGYATSPDGFTWTKYPNNPVLVMEGGEVFRPNVIRHEGMYYCFAVQGVEE